MSTPSKTAPVLSRKRLLFWSLRRELWENPWILFGPVTVAVIALLAALFHMRDLAAQFRSLATLDAVQRHAAVVRPFCLTPVPVMFTSLIVAAFFALDALYGERRDRSILFWKSLPVSDRITVLAKVSIPLLLLPLIAWVLSVATQIVMLIVATIMLAAGGVGPAALWTEFRFLESPVVMLYGLLANALWLAPIYAWFLLTSAWVRRVPALWAVLPPFALFVVEGHVFHRSVIRSFLKYRLDGALTEAFRSGPNNGAMDQVTQLDPARFLTSPGLWWGLVVAAILITLAVQTRRHRGPL